MAMLATNGLEMETESFFGIFNWNVIVLQCYVSFCYVVFLLCLGGQSNVLR